MYPSRAPVVSLVLVFLAAVFPDCVHADNPHVLVGDGARSFSLVEPKVFWHAPSNCIPSPDHGPPLNWSEPEVLSRIATSGGIVREILHEDPLRPVNTCNPYEIHSSVVADSDFLYFVDPDGLVRLSVDANVGDAPELLNSTITGDKETRFVELALGNTVVYARTYDGSDSKIYRVAKSGGTANLRWTISGVRTRRLSAVGNYVYWLNGGTLSRGSAVGLGLVWNVSSGVTGYHAEGRRTVWNPFGGNFTIDYVWIGRGRELVRHDNVTGEMSAPLYTSTDATAAIYSITSIGGGSLVILGQPSGVYFLERRRVTDPNPPHFQFYNQLLFRIPRSGGDGDFLYSRTGSMPLQVDADHLTDNGSFLFWLDEDRILRLPADAAVLPRTNMRVLGIEVTQAVQDTNHSVRLIAGKRTFVRLHVRSDDPAVSVSGVYAELRVNWQGGSGEPLAPVNDVGCKITVHHDPDRLDINHSFLFELPLEWTEESRVSIGGYLNPDRFPLEETYVDNAAARGPLTFSPSPRLEVQFVAWEFSVDNVIYSPSINIDILPTYSWIRRAYPLASKPGGGDDPSPGFRPRLFYWFDANLASLVDRSAEGCTNSLCASAYTNSQMAAWRAESGSSAFYYGFIKDIGTLNGVRMFPRGQAHPSAPVSSGPAGHPSLNSWSAWDTDESYGDWYCAHEIGHSLGRPHPGTGNPPCGHDLADPCYPYTGAAIGPDDGRLTGFDPGDGTAERAVLPSNAWTDIMSYCPYEWMSDYTYERMYAFLMGSPIPCNAAAGGADDAGGGAADIPGDWLSIFGIITDEGEAVLHRVRRLERVGRIPRQMGADYRLEQRSGSDIVVATQDFSPTRIDDDQLRVVFDFGLIVPFDAATREIRIVRTRDDKVCVSRLVSPSPPTVNNVAIQGAPGPVSGIRKLTWSANDADGDSLRFDILYRPDRAADFRPLILGHDQTDVPIDTDRLAGGGAVLRVVATDGVHSGFADTPRFTVEPKPPRPVIVSPRNGRTIQYGQLVNFIGQADDLQDGTIPENRLVWRGLGGGRFPPTGNSVTTTNLRIGENTVTLTATNSDGLSASAEVTVFVHDDLSVPGPTLSVAPRRLSWHVAPGAGGPLIASLNVSNVGAGSLSWTASENAPWLEISATSGTAPAELIVTAFPAGLPNRTVLSEEISVTGPGDQEILVPVMLSVGDVFLSDPENSGVRFIRGDCDGNGDTRGVSDALAMLTRNFVGNMIVRCVAACDANGDGQTTGVADALHLLTANFVGGVGIPAPYPGCGPLVEASDRALGCAQSSAGCQ